MAGMDNETWGVWVDDDDDDDFEALLQSTQSLEEEGNKLLQLRNQGGRGSGSSGPSLSPNLAAQAFNSRRENLHNKDPDSDRLQISGANFSQDTASQIQYLNRQYASEKENNLKLTNQLLAAQGESTNLRRQVEALKQSQQEELVARMKRDREEKQKYEETRRDLRRELSALQTELRVVRNDNEKLKSKQSMTNIANRSIGGAQSQHPTKTVYSQSAATTISSTAPTRPRSDPNLRTPVQQRKLNQIPPEPEQTKKPELVTAEKGLQANPDEIQQEIRDPGLFSATTIGAVQLNLGHMEDVFTARNIPIRRKMFQTIQKLIQLDFQNHAKARIESIVGRAPKEIMARFTRGIEMKICFPDLEENMFLYGVQYQQRKKCQDRGVTVQKKYPKLQSTLNPPIIDLDSFHRVLESSFVEETAWLALNEVKNQLQDLLSGLHADLRFRLYEYPNLQALWELLAWASHLWKFVLFEEEFKDIVEKHGKLVWIAELKAWTGLILKIDWRDFYILELEKMVREFSLNILEIIVTAGYFDSSQRRYEILYCILKNTLLADHLRNEELVKRCINIIAWSVTDNRNILNYLCINNKDGNCLARILGDNVLKCFKETKDSYKATSLLIHYFHLLESLMLQQPPRCFSTVARHPTESGHIDDDSGTEEEDDEEEVPISRGTDSEYSNMDVDMMCTQYACPEKYKFEEGCGERAKKFNNVTAAYCWINPVEWEVPIRETRTKAPENIPCQCRKILLGSTFIMLYRVVEWWKESIVQRDVRIDHCENMDVQESQILREKLEQEKKTITDPSKHLNFLQKFVVALSNDEGLDESIPAADDAEGEVDRTWDIILNKWNSSLAEDSDLIEYAHDKNRMPATVYDLAVRGGILVMNFCNFHSENIALAAGSEAFNCFTLLTSETKLFDYQPSITDAQKRSLLEIIMSVGEDEPDTGASDSVSSDSNSFTDDDEDDELSNSGQAIQSIDDLAPGPLLLQGIWENPKKKFSEDEFNICFHNFEQKQK